MLILGLCYYRNKMKYSNCSEDDGHGGGSGDG